MPDFLEEQRRAIAVRLRELKPLVEEYAQLERVAAALGRVGREVKSTTTRRARSTNGRRRRTSAASGGRATGTRRRSTTAATSRRRSTATRRRSTTASRGRTTGTRRRTTARSATTGRRRGRPRGSGTRAAQALALVKGQPGITIPELAKKMGIKQNYLYRVLPGLQTEGKVRKQGRGWHAR